MRYLKLVVVVALLGAMFAAHRLGLLHAFADPAQAKATLLGLGPWGHVAFVVAYTLMQPFGIPGTVFVMAAPLVWPWPIAFALSMIGTMAASVVGFSFARFIGREWVTAKIPPRLRRYEDLLERRAFSTVALLRFVFWMPQWLHAFFGVSNVRFWTHFWGSLVGYAPPLFVMSYFGQAIFDWLRVVRLEVWIAVAIGTGAIALGAWLVARRKRATPAVE